VQLSQIAGNVFSCLTGVTGKCLSDVEQRAVPPKSLVYAWKGFSTQPFCWNGARAYFQKVCTLIELSQALAQHSQRSLRSKKV